MTRYIEIFEFLSLAKLMAMRNDTDKMTQSQCDDLMWLLNRVVQFEETLKHVRSMLPNETRDLIDRVIRSEGPVKLPKQTKQSDRLAQPIAP